MFIIPLTQIIQPVNNSVKAFSWERLYVATWTLDFDRIKHEIAQKVTYENRPSRANQEVEIWDVIFAKMQGTQKTLMIYENEKGCIYSSWFFVLRPTNQILSWYLFHFLNSKSFLEQKDRNCTWATQKALTLEWLQKIQIPLPPLPTQKQIIQKIDKLNSLIELRKQSIEKTEKLTKSIFIEMFWELNNNSKLWNLATIIMWQSPLWDSYNTNWIWSPLLNWPTEFWEINPIEKQYTTKPKKFSNIGDILFCVRWATAWRLNISDKIYCIWRWLASIRWNKINNEFIYFILKSKYDYFQSIWQWSTFINISKDNLYDLIIPYPTISLQNKFASIVQKNEEIIKKQKLALKKLEDLYSACMQESFKF